MYLLVNINAKLRSLFLTTLGTLAAFSIAVLGRIEPAALFQHGFLSVQYLVAAILILMLSPATIFLLLADYFYFSKGNYRSAANKIFLLGFSILSFYFLAQIALSISSSDYLLRLGFGDFRFVYTSLVEYVAVFIFVFSFQVAVTLWNKRDQLSRRSFGPALLVSSIALILFSAGQSFFFGRELLYRDPMPLGLLSAAGAFVLIVELIRLSLIPRLIIGSISSIMLMGALYLTGGYSLSQPSDWSDRYVWETVFSANTFPLLIFSTISLLVFQLIYTILRRKPKSLEG